jgi:hypothetical protein
MITIMKKIYTLFFAFTCVAVFSQNGIKDTVSLIKKKTPKRDLVKKLLEADYSQPSKASKGVKDITGLTFSTGESASIPEKYREVAIEHNWNPIEMTVDEMETQYNLIMRQKYLRWIYLTMGTISLLSSIKFIRTIIK